MDEQNEHSELETQLSSLKPVHRSAIELRLIGLQYRVIAEKLTEAGYKIKEHTLRVWFMSNGVCHNSYLTIQQQRASLYDNFKEEMKYRLQEAAMDAFYILNQAVIGEKVKPSQIRAAQFILDISGFPREKGFVYTTRYETTKEDIEQVAYKVKALFDKEKLNTIVQISGEQNNGIPTNT